MPVAKGSILGYRKRTPVMQNDRVKVHCLVALEVWSKVDAFARENDVSTSSAFAMMIEQGLKSMQSTK